MATGRSYFAMPSHHFMNNAISPSTTDCVFDFDEADIWNTAAAVAISSSPEEFQKPMMMMQRGGVKKKERTVSSLPMNVPDWSKILRGDYRENRYEFGADECHDVVEEEDEETRFPPHVFLARQRRMRTASFSVHEGIGRTLKGRDLSRVRNAIWEKTGFED